jgi:deazaflavin-dependent oxidoreductase (nitroreductase family)
MKSPYRTPRGEVVMTTGSIVPPTVEDASPGRVAERTNNPLVGSASGGRVLSALQVPWFWLLPPRGFGVLTTTGRRTGKTRRKCVRAIRRGSEVYIVAIGGQRSAWIKNIQATPSVRLRIRGGWFTARARELQDPSERQRAMEAYCKTVNRFDHAEFLMHCPGRPTPAKIQRLHERWFATGTPIVLELCD